MWVLGTRLSEYQLMVADSPALLFKLTTGELEAKMGQFIRLSAVSNYEYTLTNEKRTRTVTEYRRRIWQFPATLWDHLKLVVKRKLIGFHCLCPFATKIRVNWKTVVGYEPTIINIEAQDLLDSITMQIHYLHRLGLEPRAIICHPEVLQLLKVTNHITVPDQRIIGVERIPNTLPAVYTSDCSRIFGLPVIVEREMKTHSAYVV